jgi:hypothetical protein
MKRRLVLVVTGIVLLTPFVPILAYGANDDVPTLGYPPETPGCQQVQCGYNTQGWGTIRPRTVFNGGDPTGLIKEITWSSWGGSKAVGRGLGWYVSPTEDVADGHLASAVIVAFKLGTCDGHRTYNAVEWYFPQKGQKFSSGSYEYWCNGLGYFYAATITLRQNCFRSRVAFLTHSSMDSGACPSVQYVAFQSPGLPTTNEVRFHV